MYTSAERAANAKKQLRDKYGKWIFMGGRAKWFDAIGNVFRTGKIVGIADDGNSATVKDQTSGKTYNVPRMSLEAVKARATLDPSQSTVRAVESIDNDGQFKLHLPVNQTTRPIDLKKGAKVYGGYNGQAPSFATKGFQDTDLSYNTDGQVWEVQHDAYKGTDGNVYVKMVSPWGDEVEKTTSHIGFYVEESPELDEAMETEFAKNHADQPDAPTENTPDVSATDWSKLKASTKVRWEGLSAAMQKTITPEQLEANTDAIDASPDVKVNNENVQTIISKLDDMMNALNLPTDTDSPEQQNKPAFHLAEDRGKSGDGFNDDGTWGHYGAAGVLIQAPGENGEPVYLLTQSGAGYSTGKQQWQLAGGAIDEKETPYQGTARETMEELQASEDYLHSMLPVGEIVFDKGNGWKYTNITARAPQTFEPQVDGTETQDAKWFTRAEIEDLAANDKLHPALKQRITEILDTFSAPSSAPVQEHVDAPEITDPPVAHTDEQNAPEKPSNMTDESWAGLADWEKELLSAWHDDQAAKAPEQLLEPKNDEPLQDWEKELLAGPQPGDDGYQPQDYTQAAVALQKWVQTGDENSNISYTMPDGNTLRGVKNGRDDVHVFLEDEYGELLQDWSGKATILHHEFPGTVEETAFGGPEEADTYTPGDTANGKSIEYFQNAPIGTVIKETDVKNNKTWTLIKTGEDDWTGYNDSTKSELPSPWTNYEMASDSEGKQYSQQIVPADQWPGSPKGNVNAPEQVNTPPLDANGNAQKIDIGNVDDLYDLPTGAKVQLGSQGGKTLTKGEDGLWHVDDATEGDPLSSITNTGLFQAKMLSGRSLVEVPTPPQATPEPDADAKAGAAAKAKHEAVISAARAAEPGASIYNNLNGEVYHKQSGASWINADTQKPVDLNDIDTADLQWWNGTNQGFGVTEKPWVATPTTTPPQTSTPQAAPVQEPKKYAVLDQAQLESMPTGTVVISNGQYHGSVGNGMAPGYAFVKRDDGNWNVLNDDGSSGPQENTPSLAKDYGGAHYYGPPGYDPFQPLDATPDTIAPLQPVSEPTTPDKPYFLGSIDELEALPIGTVMQEKGTKDNDTFIKTGDDQWTLQGNNASDWNVFQDSDFYDGVKEGYLQVQPKAPEQLAEPDTAATPGQVKSTADFAKLPVGTTVVHETGDVAYKKTAPNTWTHVDSGSSFPDTSFASSIASGHISVVPENAPDEAPELPKVQSKDELANLPVGTVIRHESSQLHYAKTGPASWKEIESSYSFYDNDFGPSIDNGNISLVKMGEEAPTPEAPSNEPEMSIAELAKAAPGTAISSNGTTWVKGTDGYWTEPGHNEKVQTGEFYWAIQDGGTKWAPESNASAASLKSDKPTSEKELFDAPQGTQVITAPGEDWENTWTKSGDGYWVDKNGVDEDNAGLMPNVNAGNIKWATPEPAPTSGPVSDVSELDNAPVGSKITWTPSSDSIFPDPEIYEKQADGQWLIINPGKAQIVINSAEFKQTISQNQVTWGGPAAEPGADSKIGQTASWDEVQAAPIGARLTKQTTGSVLEKTGIGKWKNLTTGSDVSESGLSYGANGGNLKWLTDPTPTEAPEPPAPKGIDASNVPVGTVFKNSGSLNASFIKTAPNTWTYKNQGATLSVDDDTAKSIINNDGGGGASSWYQDAEPVNNQPTPSTPSGPSGVGKDGNVLQLGDIASHPLKGHEGKIIDIDMQPPSKTGGDNSIVTIQTADGTKFKYRARFINLKEKAASGQGEPTVITKPTYQNLQDAPLNSKITLASGMTFTKTANNTWRSDANPENTYFDSSFSYTEGHTLSYPGSKPTSSAPTPDVDTSSPWYGQPEPQEPVLPTDVRTDYALDQFYQEIASAFPAKYGHSFESDDHWNQWENLSKNGSDAIVTSKNEQKYGPQKDIFDFFSSRGLVSPETAAKARAHYAQVNAENKSRTEGYANAKVKYAKDLEDWKRANGIPLSSFSAHNTKLSDPDTIHTLLGMVGDKGEAAKYVDKITPDASVLTAKDKAAFNNWVGGGAEYGQPGTPDYIPSIQWENLSMELRKKGEAAHKNPELLTENNRRVVKAINDAIDKIETTDDLVITRLGNPINFNTADGTQLKSINDLKALQGSVIADYGIFAASPGGMPGYASSGNELFIRVRVPKGAHVGWLGGKMGINGGYGDGGENEILLPPGSKFYVHQFLPPTHPQAQKDKNGYRRDGTLVVDLVPDGWTPGPVQGEFGGGGAFAGPVAQPPVV